MLVPIDELYDSDCQRCRDAAKDYDELNAVVDNLATIVVRLSRSLKTYDPGLTLPSTAMKYLHENGLYKVLREP